MLYHSNVASYSRYCKSLIMSVLINLPLLENWYLSPELVFTKYSTSDTVIFEYAYCYTVFSKYKLYLIACLCYRSNCTKSICFESIRLQEYVYTSGAESDRFDLNSIRGTTFTRVVRNNTRQPIRSSSIRFEYHSPRWYHWNRISSIRFTFTRLLAKSNQFELIRICVLSVNGLLC